MKKALTLAFLCICLAGCNFRERGSLRPTGFEATVSDISGTRAHVRINPQDDHAWYTYMLLYDRDIDYSKPDSELADRIIAKANEIYDHYSATGENNVAQFSDFFCFQGNRDFRIDFLEPDTDYRMFIFQMDPFQKIHIGGTLSVYFNTPPIDYSDLSFEVSFTGDVLRIEPSDPEATYIWEYEKLSKIEDGFGVEHHFFGRLVYLYEDYDFIEDLIDKGTVEWEFSKDDPAIKEGCEYSLMIAGYDGVDINTPMSVLHFVYRKGNIEVTYRDW